MAKYGLQWGIDDSKHTHIFTRQCYRDVKKLPEELKVDVAELQERKEAAQEEINWAKKEIQTEKLKEMAIIAATNIAESVVSLFGSNNVKTLKRENTVLHREVANHEKAMESL